MNGLPVKLFYTQNSDADYLASITPSIVVPNDNLYTNYKSLHPLLLLRWILVSNSSASVNGSSSSVNSTDLDTISFEIRSKVKGWVGIGFNPNTGTMKGADCIYASITSVSPLAFTIYDAYARDVGLPSNDATLGSVNDVFDTNAFIEASTGIQVFRFKRKLITSDGSSTSIKRDVNFVSGQKVELMWAFHLESRAAVYHGQYYGRHIHIDFMQREVTPAPKIFTKIDQTVITEDSDVLRLALTVVAGVMMLFPLIVMALVIKNGKHPRIRAATFQFCVLIPFGCMVGYAAVIVATALDKTDTTCSAFFWLTSVAWVLTFTPIIAKTWRVVKIFNTGSNLKKVLLPLLYLNAFIAFMLAIEMILLAVWQTTSPFRALYVQSSTNTFTDSVAATETTVTTLYHTCALESGSSSAEIFLYIWIFLKIFCLLAAAYLSFAMRNVNNPLFNESSGMAQSIYVTLVLSFLCIILGFSFKGFKNVDLIVKAVAIFFSFTFTLISQFIPKIKDIYWPAADVMSLHMSRLPKTEGESQIPMDGESKTRERQLIGGTSGGSFQPGRGPQDKYGDPASVSRKDIPSRKNSVCSTNTAAPHTVHLSAIGMGSTATGSPGGRHQRSLSHGQSTRQPLTLSPASNTKTAGKEVVDNSASPNTLRRPSKLSTVTNSALLSHKPSAHQITSSTTTNGTTDGQTVIDMPAVLDSGDQLTVTEISSNSLRKSGDEHDFTPANGTFQADYSHHTLPVVNSNAPQTPVSPNHPALSNGNTHERLLNVDDLTPARSSSRSNSTLLAEAESPHTPMPGSVDDPAS